MVRIDAFIFGYRRITVSADMVSEVTSRFIRAGIISAFNNDGTITIRERDGQRVRAALSGIPYEESETLGLYGAYKRIKHKKAIICAALLSALITLIASGTIWDIRVEGNENLTDAKIIHELSGCGFSIGNLWHFSDRSEAESEFLRKVPEISWININRRGMVAYVSVIERNADKAPVEEDASGYANIVAAYDCIIEEITVISGTAVVKPGDVVKKGDLLISGVLPIESGGGFCYADGRVVGRMSDCVSAEVEREYEKRSVKKRKLCDLNINFFDFSINIFKLYGNSPDGCDIIENVKVFSLFGEKRLPFSISSSYVIEYDVLQQSYTDEQLVGIARDRLNVKMLACLSDADLLKIKTAGEYTDTGYLMKSDIVFCREIGEVSEFSME